ncbi:hypothetical protein HO133_003172 [Letharia lupina]|uniref:Uncharacterized protein n=1 Tax=Letharia lupina TaxID=560253 RepID=A0A8H6CC62_9LECA|nr:uncharacterized protein HO133_003172 [Letharia lupina]KAF6220739.1 hypothetical protein HO133_003172 [Letharia lupina]
MHFSAVILAALSAGAHALPTADANIGGDLSSNLNPGPHNPAIGIFSNPSCEGKELQTPLSFPAAGCYPFDSAFDTVGINFGGDDNCGLNVYTDPNCGNFATHTLTGDINEFTCLSMSANGGPWKSLAPAECHPEAITDNPGVPEAQS